MVEMFPSIEIYGESYSPALVEKDTIIKFSYKNEKGDIGKRGKYKEKPLPYGSSSIKPPSNLIDENEKLLWLIDILKKHKEKILKCGATDMTFHIAINYQFQCNFDFKPIFLKEIGELNIPFTITCVNMTNESDMNT
jgi:hypothetical protein